MKAVLLTDHAENYEVLRLAEVERPKLGPRDVLLEVHATGFNPFDSKLRRGRVHHHYPVPLPHVLGNDIAGVVVEKGSAVSKVEIGDRVYGLQVPMRWGGYAEYCAIDASYVRKIPRNVTFEQAAALPMVIETAWLGLVDYARLQPGKLVLIQGGAGGVGGVAIQLARALGATVAATCSSDAVEFVREQGAHFIVDYQTQDFRELLRDVDVVFDPIGGQTNLHSYEVMKPGGMLLTVLREDRLEIENRDRLCEKHKVTCRVVAFENHPTALDGVETFLTSGKIIPAVTQVLPLERAADAHRACDAGHARGKTVIKVR